MTTAAVVGTGFIGPVHVEALRRLNIPVKGVLGSSPGKSERAADILGLQTGYASFEDLLADREVDIVHIASPNRFHLEQAAQALEAGKHVVCEKPLALNTAETARLVEASKQHPELVAAVNYNVRFYPLVLQARELVRQGALGNLYTVTGCYWQDWLLKDTDWNWRLEPEQGGALRAIGDIGTHWLDLLGFVTGRKVQSLLADLETFVKQRQRSTGSVETFSSSSDGPHGRAGVDTEMVNIETEDFGAVLLHYEGGARGVLSVSQVSAGRKNRLTFEIAGSKGALAWDSETPNQLWLGHRDRANEILIKDPALLDVAVRPYTSYPGGHTEGFPDTFKQLYRAVYDYLQVGDFTATKPFPTFEDGHFEVLLCEKILQSHQERRWVDV